MLFRSDRQGGVEDARWSERKSDTLAWDVNIRDANSDDIVLRVNQGVRLREIVRKIRQVDWAGNVVTELNHNLALGDSSDLSGKNHSLTETVQSQSLVLSLGGAGAQVEAVVCDINPGNVDSDGGSNWEVGLKVIEKRHIVTDLQGTDATAHIWRKVDP